MTLAELVVQAVAWLGVLASLLWFVVLAQVVRHRRSVLLLADLPGDEPAGGWPRLAVVFAARNEAAEVEAATRSLVAQDYPNLEIIAVDDRSTDATGAILDRLTEDDSRLRVVHVRELPPGWLGKNHALHSAAQATEADWLLFTDADVVFAPGALRKAVAFALREQADHLTVVPQMPTETVDERIFMCMFNLIFVLHSPLRKVVNPRSRAFIGVGAFNLVRAGAFEAIGGLHRLALSVDDDMRLGQALKWGGYRTRMLVGLNSVSVRWHVGAAGMVRGLEKNFFAGLEFKLRMVALAVGVVLWAGCGPHAGLWVGPWWSRVVCAGGVGALAVLLQFVGRTSGIHAGYALALPVSAAMIAWAILRSTWQTLRRGGVRWRDHFYPLAELKAHVHRRNAWTRELWRSTR
jgi:glycosyltransferase involved in cell wall biosynthesis